MLDHIRTILARTLGHPRMQHVASERDWQALVRQQAQLCPALKGAGIGVFCECRAHWPQKTGKAANPRIDVVLYDTSSHEVLAAIELKLATSADAARMTAQDDHDKLKNLVFDSIDPARPCRPALVAAVLVKTPTPSIHLHDGQRIDVLDAPTAPTLQAPQRDLQQWCPIAIQREYIADRPLLPFHNSTKRYHGATIWQGNEADTQMAVGEILATARPGSRAAYEVKMPYTVGGRRKSARVDLTITDNDRTMLIYEPKEHTEQIRSHLRPRLLSGSALEGFVAQFVRRAEDISRNGGQANDTPKHPRKPNGAPYLGNHFVTKMLECRKDYARTLHMVRNGDCDKGVIYFYDICMINDSQPLAKGAMSPTPDATEIRNWLKANKQLEALEQTASFRRQLLLRCLPEGLPDDSRMTAEYDFYAHPPFPLISPGLRL